MGESGGICSTALEPLSVHSSVVPVGHGLPGLLGSSSMVLSWVMNVPMASNVPGPFASSCLASPKALPVATMAPGMVSVNRRTSSARTSPVIAAANATAAAPVRIPRLRPILCTTSMHKEVSGAVASVNDCDAGG